MNSPLKVLDKPESLEPARRKDNVIAINPNNGPLLDRLSSSSVGLALHDFKHRTDYRDSKFVDYLLIGVLSVLVHSAAVEYFRDLPPEPEAVKQPKPPAKVQISFVKPQPPKPVVQEPPPPPKVVALKKPPKPKIPPKPEPVIEQAPTPGPVSNIAPPAPPAPAPVVEKVTQPRGSAGYKNNPQAEFPDVAIEHNWEGRVLLKVHVLANGTPDSISVVTSSGHDVLDESAVKTVGRWTFEPAKRGNTPIDGWVTVPINFKLDN
jgi:protein TonB